MMRAMSKTDAHHDHHSKRYSLAELTEAAGVSVRTVRYYIAEGLLPPAVTAGTRSFYTQAHLDRLRLIGQLKSAYLPLKEIRRRLAGLDDEEVRRLVATSASSPGDDTAPPAAHDSAADYLARIRPRAFEAEELKAGLNSGTHFFLASPEYWRLSTESGTRHASERLFAPSREDSITGEGTWRRVPLSEDAELLIREEAYQRRRDRIDWLIRWARKVFG